MRQKYIQTSKILNSAVMGADFPLVAYMDIKSDEIYNISNISVTCASFSLVM